MQDGEGMKLDEQGTREEETGVHGLAALENSLVGEWRRFRPGGESGQLRRQLRRQQKAERRMKARQRRRSTWLARRRRREFANLERQLLGGHPTGLISRFSRSEAEAEVEPETGPSVLDSRISAAVEAALARQREELIREFQQTIDFRVRLAVKAMEHRQQESEERVVERAEKAISRVTGDMAQSLDRRLGKEAERIEKEVERSVGVEMGRMYLRLSKPAEGDALPGRRP